MSASGGVTHYHEEIKDLLRLLQHLPDTIPIGDDHNFIGYAPDGKEVDEKGCIKTVISHDIGRSFGPRRTPAGEDIIITFKSRGPGLEEVATVLRDFITGNGGPNVLLTQWVDDLRHAARVAIDAAGKRVNYFLMYSRFQRTKFIASYPVKYKLRLQSDFWRKIR
jgi:hypothetical protein